VPLAGPTGERFLARSVGADREARHDPDSLARGARDLGFALEQRCLHELDLLSLPQDSCAGLQRSQWDRTQQFERNPDEAHGGERVRPFQRSCEECTRGAAVLCTGVPRALREVGWNRSVPIDFEHR